MCNTDLEFEGWPDLPESYKLGVYEQIVFLQGDAADEALELYYERGPESALELLCQWHYPGEHDTADEPGAGRLDDVDVIGDYIITTNFSLNYIGLEFKL